MRREIMVMMLAMPALAWAQETERVAPAVAAPAQAPRNPLRPIVRTGDTLYLSGQIGSDPVTRELVPGGIATEVRQTLENVKRLVESEGGSLGQVAKCTVFLTSISDFATMNEVYRQFFPQNPPARATVQVVALPNPKALVEMDCIAVVPARQKAG